MREYTMTVSSTAGKDRAPEAPLRALTEEEITTYDRDGVVLARGLFSDEWVERIGDAIDHVAANPTPFGKLLSGRGLHSDLFMWKYDDTFRDFVYRSPAAHIAGQLMRSMRVNFLVDHMFKKNVGCEIPTVWHRDEPAWPVTGEQCMNIWLACDPVDRANSALEFIAGSHRWPSAPTVHTLRGGNDNRVGAALDDLGWKPAGPSTGNGTAEPLSPSVQQVMKLAFQGVHRQLEEDMAHCPLPPVQDAGLVSIEKHRAELPVVGWDVQPGDVLLFHFRTLHYSSGNPTGTRPRRALGTRWLGDDARFTPTIGNIPLFWPSGLRPGSPFGGSLFPQVLPTTEPGVGTRRQQGAEEADAAIGYVDFQARMAAGTHVAVD
jgi:ectoine hydroxylase-related dioxygenase (phytanoyl-CoA dioxygenase family)